MLPASGKVFYDVGVVCCLSVVELGVLFGEDLRELEGGAIYFLTRITTGGKKLAPRTKWHLGGLHTEPLTKPILCVPTALSPLDPPNATTGHNLLAHVITFQLSHWGTLNYSRCSDCIQ